MSIKTARLLHLGGSRHWKKSFDIYIVAPTAWSEAYIVPVRYSQNMTFIAATGMRWSSLAADIIVSYFNFNTTPPPTPPPPPHPHPPPTPPPPPHPHPHPHPPHPPTPNTDNGYKVTMSRTRHWRNFAINIYSVALTTWSEAYIAQPVIPLG